MPESTSRDQPTHFAPDTSGLLTGLHGATDTPRGGPGEGEDGPVQTPPDAPRNAGRYRLDGEIARGGMGAILKGHDTDLGRELAVKVLLDSHKDRPEVARRFIEEARISGQLQHPGIVPVYELGRFADDRPFFSMKLVKGQTLLSLLAARKDVADDRPRFLGVFQQICLTMAYAHSRGVIHRDLKPANVMVGAFGEVQVMDWGLAKVLTEAGDRPEAGEGPRGDSVIRTVQLEEASGAPPTGTQTVAGSVMGTPAYMPPEQAMGEVDRLDERADVFGLGAILCEILTGKPPYTGRDGTGVFRQATRGKLEGCHARLDGCGAEPGLIELARECLATEPDQRPRHAGVVADRVTAYLASVQSRLRAAEIEGAAAAARAEEASAKARAERRTRRWQVGLATVVITLTAVAGFAAVWVAAYQSRLKLDALVARQRAEAEKKRADLTLADMQTSRGMLSGERGAAAEAVLWFAAAAQQSADAGDRVREEHNGVRARNWMRLAPSPEAVLSPEGRIEQLDFQPGGELLLVRTHDRLHLWDWAVGKVLPWAEKLAGVRAACFAPDGAAVALGFHSGEVQLRSLADGRLASSCRHVGPIRALAFSPDGKSLALGSGSVRVWDVGRQAFRRADWKHPQPVNALMFNRKGDRLITACDDRQARVYAVPDGPGADGPLFAPLPHAPYAASPPALTGGDRTLVTVTGSKELARWDLTTGKPASERVATKAWGLQRVVGSPDGKWFATGGYYGPEVHPADGQGPVLQLGHTNAVRDMVFSRDGTLLLSVSSDRTARLWSLPEGRPVGEPLVHTYGVSHAALSDDATLVAVALYDGLVRVWRRPRPGLVLSHQTGWGERPRLSFDGKLVAPGLWHEGTTAYSHQRIAHLLVLTAADGKAAGPRIALPGFLVDSCIGADGRSVAAVLNRNGKGLLGVWDVATGRSLVAPFPLPGVPISAAARPGSPHLAALCTSGDLLVCDGRTGKVLHQTRLPGWTESPARSPCVRYTPDGGALVGLATGADAAVHVLDAGTWQPRFAALRPVLQARGGGCRGFAFSADSRLMATMVNGKNAVQVWDLATGEAMSQPLLHPGEAWGLYSVCFSADGRHLLTANHDRRVRYWDWVEGKLACPPLGHDDEVFDAVLTPDGRFALTATRSQPALEVWELATGRQVAPPVPAAWLAPPTSARPLSVTPDGQRAVVGFSSKDVMVVDLGALLASTATPAADLGLLAELVTAQHFESGELSGLATGQWLQRWNLLRDRNPLLVRSRATEVRSLAPPPEVVRAAVGAAARGAGFARRGQWAPAAREALAEVAASPGNRLLWAKAAPLLILAGDAEGYRRTCRRMLEQFEGAADVEQADSVIKACLLLPDGADRSKLPAAVLADEVERAPAQPHGWFFACLALHAYRDGRFERALNHAGRSRQINRGHGPEGALSLLVLAMAHHRLGHAGHARAALDAATALLPPELAALGTPAFRGSLPVNAGVIGWDWLNAEVLRREATLLVRQTRPGADKP